MKKPTKSKSPTSVKFEEDDAKWLSDVAEKSRGMLPQHQLIAFAVKELRREMDAGAQIVLSDQDGLKLVHPDKGA